MGWQKRESAGLDSHDRTAVNRKISVYLGVSHNPDFFQIAPIYCLPVQVAFSASNIEEYIPVLVIGSDGPPKPKKNYEVPLSVCICVPNLFLMKLNATKCKEPRVCFVKRPSATPFTNWSTSTQNSSFTQGSRQWGRGGRCLPGNRKSVQWTLRLSRLSASLLYVPS